MSRTIKLAIVVSVALFLVVSATSITRASEEPQVVNVALKDYQVTASRFVVTSDRPVQFVVMNEGTLPHRFVVQPISRSERANLDDAPVIGSGTLRTIQMSLSPGVYNIECAVKDHVERGMFTAIAAEATPRTVSSIPTAPLLSVLMLIVGCVYLIADSAGLRLTWNK